jgi:hypothetical protein
MRLLYCGGALSCFLNPASVQAVARPGRWKLILAGLTTGIPMRPGVVRTAMGRRDRYDPRGMIDLDLDALRRAAGIGVAGNFAGHLEQAGEAADFAQVVPATPGAPKGIFPWFVPGRGSYLGTFPLSCDQLVEPGAPEAAHLQIEPEVGALCRATYDPAGHVTGLEPVAVGAFNDCSIRCPNAVKISEKKNWGAHAKGIAPRFFASGDLDPDGALQHLRIASFLRRDGVAHPYGIDSPARGYSYAGATLVDWIVDRLRHQTGTPETPLESVGEYLDSAGRPDMLVVGIGATRYTPFGETTYLVPGDESIVIVYDETVSTPEQVIDAVVRRVERDLPRASVLCQAVLAAA